MARGKYSPTVSAAYMADQEWHRRLLEAARTEADPYPLRDADGYDAYGYDEHDKDRAGNDELDYLLDDTDEHDEPLGFNSLYDRALQEWTFDGTRPVRR